MRGIPINATSHCVACSLVAVFSISLKRLTWHDGVIPQEEVWIKMGGDKGGGSFKMSLQPANVYHPNSIHNTFVFCCFEAADTVTNLHVALDTYSKNVDDLQATKWRLEINVA